MTPEAPKPPKERDVQDGSTVRAMAWFLLPWLVGVLMFVAVALLPACAPVDRGRCLQSHIQPAWMQMLPMTRCGGNPMRCTTQIMPIFHPETLVCDRWEFPDGRPEGVAA